MSNRTRIAALGILPALWAFSACGGVSSAVQDPFDASRARNEFRLFVQNDNFYDARIFALPSGGVRRQLGYVGGKTDGVFTVPWAFSQDLRVEIDLLAGPTCTTERIQVDPGDELRLQILASPENSAFCR